MISLVSSIGKDSLADFRGSFVATFYGDMGMRATEVGLSC